MLVLVVVVMEVRVRVRVPVPDTGLGVEEAVRVWRRQGRLAVGFDE